MKFKQNIFALLAGALLPFAFAPFHFTAFSPLLIAIIAPAILLLLISQENCSPRQAFWRGGLFGLGYFGVGISWIYISIHIYGNTPSWLAVIFTAICIMIETFIHPALLGYLLQRFFSKNNFYQYLIAFPILWVLLEWLRSWFLTGFPWLLIGHSQSVTFLRGYLPIVGTLGMSFIIVFCSGILVAWWRSRRCLHWPLISALFLIFITGMLLNKIHWTQANGKVQRITLVQGNVPQELKWSREYLESTLQRYTELSFSELKNSDIIIWPEAAIPLDKASAQPFLRDLDQLGKKNHVSFITGIPSAADENNYYNSAIALGNGEGEYNKRHLVPFGEYVPLASLLRGLISFLDLPMSNFISGAKHQTLLSAGQLKIAPFICYEIAYDETVRAAIPTADIFLTMSNDAWFDRSIALDQHLQIAQTQALQNGRNILFVANTGITAFINAEGIITSRLAIFTTATLTEKVSAMNGRTPWSYYGNTPIIILLMLTIIFIYYRQKNPKK